MRGEIKAEKFKVARAIYYEGDPWGGVEGIRVYVEMEGQPSIWYETTATIEREEIPEDWFK